MRQDDDAAHDRGLRGADERPHLLRGGDVTDVPPAKRHVNMVFQGYALFPHMTVADNVAFGLRAQAVAVSDVARRASPEALALVRLAGWTSVSRAQLSGGQQQRVALARALVIDPPCSCWTSRSARSTSSCARRCSSS